MKNFKTFFRFIVSFFKKKKSKPEATSKEKSHFHPNDPFGEGWSGQI